MFMLELSVGQFLSVGGLGVFKISPIFIKRSDSEASLENMTDIMVFEINCQARKKLKATVTDMLYMSMTC